MTAPTTRETADHAPDSGKMVQTPMHRDAAKATLALSGTAGHEELLRRALQDAQELSRRGLNPDVRLNAAEREAVAHVLSEIAALRDYGRDVAKEALEYRRQRDELRKALEWYGEQARLARLIHREGDAGRHALADDGGKLARALLANQGADQ